MFSLLDTESNIPSFRALASALIHWLPFLFRTVALVVAAPLIFFFALDIVAYLIARTVGAGSPHNRHGTSNTSAHIVSIPQSTSKDTPSIVISDTSILSSFAKHGHQLPTPPSEDQSPTAKFPTHFTSASEGNFALAGEGMFSPPESRSNSPPLDRKEAFRTRKRAASVGVEALGAITDSEDAETSSSASSSTSGESSIGTGPTSKSSSSALSPGGTGAPLRKRKPGLQFTPLLE